jgi:uncharacterized MAPEG superfamily protein
MLDLTLYQTSLLWVGILLAVIILQWLIASYAKASEPGAIPGHPPRALGHANFAFRAWRTHQNTLENASTMIGGAIFAILAGANPAWLQGLLAIMVVSRIAHMALYYGIATDKNPSPRSYFFMISWLANVAVIVLGIIAIIV